MKRLILSLLTGLISLFSFSQTGITEFLKGGKADAGKLAQAYLEPYVFALGDGLSNGWYNSAETHRIFGFDFSITLSAIQIPEKSKTFDIAKLELANTSVSSGGNIAPTIAGADVSGPKMVVKDNQGNSFVSFNMPKGLEQDIVPVPMAQFTFGLLPNTDVIGRYVPEMNYTNEGDEMKFGFWGVGVKHNFLEWFPLLKELPFDAALFASYSEVNAQSQLSFTPDDYGIENVSVTYTNDQNQLLRIKTHSGKYGLVISKKLGFLTLFGGVGQSTCETSIDVIGKYPVLTKGPNGGLAITNEDALIDPIAIQYESRNVSLDAGLRIKLAFLRVFGSVSKSEYTSYHAGLSLSIR